MKGYYDISYLCKFYASSISVWEKWKSGSPIDGASRVDRYSIHTEEELSPFIHFDLPFPLHINSIELFMRDAYVDAILPVDLILFKNDIELRKLIIKNPGKNSFDVGLEIDSIRIINNKFGALNLSSVKIYVDVDDFYEGLSLFDSDFDAVAVVIAKFYGLGGRLAVTASALGYLGAQSNIKDVVVDADTGGVLLYPRKINEILEKENYKKIFNKYVNSHLQSYIFSGVGYSSKKNIARYVEDNPFHEQLRKFVLITRDFIKSFKNSSESDIECKQRLYSRIIPSEHVLRKVAELESNKALDESLYSRALGIHIRHGNGERYFSPQNKIWGVKPPNKISLKKSVDEILQKNPSIETMLVCTDCIAVFDYLKDEYGGYGIDLIMLSDNIQPIGRGCNHNNNTWVPFPNRLECERAVEDLNTFSEIIALSKCAFLSGGSSYFYDAVVGFSRSSCDNIYYNIDNKERYIKITDAIPFLEVKSDISNQVADLMDNAGVMVDGIFFLMKDDKIFELRYFDEVIFYGDIENFSKNLKNVHKKLIDVRFY